MAFKKGFRVTDRGAPRARSFRDRSRDIAVPGIRVADARVAALEALGDEHHAMLGGHEDLS